MEDQVEAHKEGKSGPMTLAPLMMVLVVNILIAALEVSFIDPYKVIFKLIAILGSV